MRWENVALQFTGITGLLKKCLTKQYGGKDGWPRSRSTVSGPGGWTAFWARGRAGKRGVRTVPSVQRVAERPLPGGGGSVPRSRAVHTVWPHEPVTLPGYLAKGGLCPRGKDGPQNQGAEVQGHLGGLCNSDRRVAGSPDPLILHFSSSFSVCFSFHFSFYHEAGFSASQFPGKEMAAANSSRQPSPSLLTGQRVGLIKRSKQ